MPPCLQDPASSELQILLGGTFLTISVPRGSSFTFMARLWSILAFYINLSSHRAQSIPKTTVLECQVQMPWEGDDR